MEWGEYLKISRETNRDGAVLLGWTGDNGDPDNFLARAARLRRRRRQQPRAVVQRASSTDLIKKAKITGRRSRPSAPSSTKRRRSCSSARRRGRPLLTPSRVHADVQEGHRLQVMDPLGYHRFDGVDIAE
jgi:dipeptide transport system substrate-binding protein